jgi:hypothetical protein
MNISPRFTEFGMTGAFFLLSQLCIVVLLGSSTELTGFLHTWARVLDAYEGSLPDMLKKSVGSLVTVVGLISIFIAGLILDLIGSYFALLEMILFNRHLKHNQIWLNELSEQCQENVREDYRTLRDFFDTSFIVSPRKFWERIHMSRQYKNIQAFLFSYVQVFSSMSEMLADNMHMWRTSRAISTTLLILAIEVFFFSGQSGQVLMAFGVLFCFSALITLRSYSRLCFNLFSLACVTQEKRPKS